MNKGLQFFLGLFVVVQAGAATLSDVTMPDTAVVDSKSLSLNGLGRREATVFNVGVYVAGLYLENKSSSADEILASPQVKRLDMEFIRDVEQKKIVDAFKSAIPENCLKDCDKINPALETFLSQIPAAKKGDKMSFVVFPDRVLPTIKGEVKAPIASAEFAKAFLGAWIGKKPPNKSLKEGLLGKSKK